MPRPLSSRFNCWEHLREVILSQPGAEHFLGFPIAIQVCPFRFSESVHLNLPVSIMFTVDDGDLREGVEEPLLIGPDSWAFRLLLLFPPTAGTFPAALAPAPSGSLCTHPGHSSAVMQTGTPLPHPDPGVCSTFHLDDLPHFNSVCIKPLFPLRPTSFPACPSPGIFSSYLPCSVSDNHLF